MTGKKFLNIKNLVSIRDFEYTKVRDEKKKRGGLYESDTTGFRLP